MKRYTRLAFAYVLSMTAFSPAAAQQRGFDFLGFRTDEPTPIETKLAGKRCRVAREDVSSCTIFAGAILGRARVLDLSITFNYARMIKVTGMVMPSFYRDLVEAFEAKYGLPSSFEVRTWRDKFGANFDNEVRIWKFTDGALELHQRGEQKTISKFVFLANHNLPQPEERKKPPINF